MYNPEDYYIMKRLKPTTVSDDLESSHSQIVKTLPQPNSMGNNNELLSAKSQVSNARTILGMDNCLFWED